MVKKSIINGRKSYIFKTPSGEREISVDEIIYFKYEHRHVVVRTVHETFPTSLTRFRDIESAVDPDVFISIHRACLVNKAFIKQVGSLTLTVESGEKLSVSRYKVGHIEESLKKQSNS